MSRPDLHATAHPLPVRTPVPLQRRRVLITCAALVLFFAVADAVAVQGFPARALAVRVVWALILLGLALAGPRVRPGLYPLLTASAALVSAGAMSLVAHFTGGSAGGLFAWNLALPVAVAVVLQEDTRAVLVGVVATWLGGMAVMSADGRPLGDLGLWSLLYAASGAIAMLGSSAYRQVRQEEGAAVQARLEAITLLAASERDRGLAEQAQADAEAATQVRQEVLDIVAHDLRSPLTSITTVAQMLLAKTPAEDPGRKKLETLWRSARHMNRLINDLLDISRLEGARFALELQPHPVAELLGQTLDTMQPLASARRQSLLRGETPAEVVQCDQLRIFQVLCNLMGNAIKFTPEEGTITVSARRLATEIEFCVRDTGPGIGPEELPQIFGQFWQARASDSRGIGLGLAIAKGIVEAHRGRIWVESEPGEGATFRFTLPLVEKRPG